MSAYRLIKHNPLFMSDEELETTFVVREAELGILGDLVRANTGEVNQHALVIGPRGMGKTVLMRRLALLVRSDPVLNKAWHPIIAPEEIYDAATEGEIWLAVLKSYAEQERRENGDFERWNGRYEALIKESDEDRLRARTLGALTEISHERGKRLLVLIENLQMLLGEQFSKDADWDLRRTLLNRPEIMLVLTATTRFDQIEKPGFAAYELFRELELKPLSTDDCRRLWRAVSGQELTDQRIRPMEILTGGNPRLLAILATFAPEKPLGELMDNLAELIDDHTPFLKSNIDALSPQERRVFANLAKLWEPSTSRQVGEHCRLSSNMASAVLKNLVHRGIVLEVGKEGRGKLYQVAERIYCIYYLLRLCGSEADRMRAFVQFMVSLYGGNRFLAGYQQPWMSNLADEVREPVLEVASSALSEAQQPIEEAAEILRSANQALFASLYGLADWDQVFEQVQRIVNDTVQVESHFNELLTLLIDAAADEQAERILELLSSTVAEQAMEPLVAALKELVGETCRAPQEIEEVKKDVLDRIDQRRHSLKAQRARLHIPPARRNLQISRSRRAPKSGKPRRAT